MARLLPAAAAAITGILVGAAIVATWGAAIIQTLMLNRKLDEIEVQRQLEE